MGQLTLPQNSSVYMDTNCVIYSYERVEPDRTILQPYWDGATAGTVEIITSEFTILEALVKPFKTQNTRLEAGLRQLLLQSSDVRLLPISRAVLERAARLRAETTLKTPDAIHAATALLAGAILFVTNDAAFRTLPGLNATVLSDLITP